MRRFITQCFIIWNNISIHAPLTGCDGLRDDSRFKLKLFQSTHPLRDATLNSHIILVEMKFQSTHPLRDATGNGFKSMFGALFQSTHPLRDATVTSVKEVYEHGNFNPRTPYGMRHVFNLQVVPFFLEFQSTHPLRDATV